MRDRARVRAKLFLENQFWEVVGMAMYDSENDLYWRRYLNAPSQFKHRVNR